MAISEKNAEKVCIRRYFFVLLQRIIIKEEKQIWNYRR